MAFDFLKNIFSKEEEPETAKKPSPLVPYGGNDIGEWMPVGRPDLAYSGKKRSPYDVAYSPQPIKPIQPIQRSGDFVFQEKSQKLSLTPTLISPKLKPIGIAETLKYFPAAFEEAKKDVVGKIGTHLIETYASAIPETLKGMQEGKPLFTAYKDVWNKARDEDREIMETIREQHEVAVASGVSKTELAKIATQSPEIQKMINMTIAFSSGMRMVPKDFVVMQPETSAAVKGVLPKLKSYLNKLVEVEGHPLKNLYQALKQSNKTGLINQHLEQAILSLEKEAGEEVSQILPQLAGREGTALMEAGKAIKALINPTTAVVEKNILDALVHSAPAIGSVSDSIITHLGKLAGKPEPKPTAIPKELEPLAEETTEILRGTKGLTADAIMQKYPDIKLTKDVPATDIYGNKVVIEKGESLTPYELKGNKILLQDGETYIVSKNQYQNIKGQSKVAEAKEFAPELEGLEETVKGKSKWQGDELIDNGNRLADVYKGSNGKWHYRSDMVEESPAFKTRKEAMENAEADVLGIYSGNETKFSDYQLPGGKKYKEILIKAPDRGMLSGMLSDVEFEALDQIALKKYNQSYLSLTEESSVEANEKRIEVREEYKKQNPTARSLEPSDITVFPSPHWKESNVISHIRLNERTYKGKKATFLEELQSDWAKEMRKQSDYLKKQYPSDPDFIARQKAKFPTYPLLKKWQELSIKRALQEAVANKSTYFSWITGEQTSARYNLATHLESVEWKTGGADGTERQVALKVKGGGTTHIGVDPDGTINFGQSGWQGKSLDQVIGKGLADKIMEKGSGTLSGEGLKFGGEWAVNLYDKQVKNIVKDLTGGNVIKMDMGLPVEKEKINWGSPVLRRKIVPNDLKVGLEIGKIHDPAGAIPDRIRDRYIITDVIGDGKFKAVSKEVYNGKIGEGTSVEGNIYSTKALKLKDIEQHIETFDISIKKTTQQGVKLTAAVKDKILGKAPKIKTSGKMLEPKPQVPTEAVKAPLEPLKPEVKAESKETLEDYLEGLFKKEKPEIEKAIKKAESEILTTFEQAEAGERVMVSMPTQKEGARFVRKPSTFPDWIPEHLRQKPILDAIANHIKNGTKPSANAKRQVELYNLTKSRILEEAGIPEENVKAVLDYLEAKPSKLSPKASPVPTDKYAFNINMERLNLTKSGKAILKETVEQLRPELERIKGKPLTHKEVLEEANRSGMLASAITREQQLERAAAIENLRAKVATLSNALDNEGVEASPELWEEYLKALKEYSAVASETGRMLESLKINAGDESLRDNLIKDIFRKTNVSANIIVARAKEIDFENMIEAQRFYREFVKPRFTEYLNDYRYTNMLSNPKTNIVNLLTGILQPPVVAGIKLYSGGIDAVGSYLFGKERSHYVKEIVPYTKGYINAIPEAFQAMKEAFAGKKTVQAPRVMGVDVFNVPAIVKGIGWKFKFLTRALEAADVFNHTLLTMAEAESLAYKYSEMGKEVIPENIMKEASDEALRLIFRGYGGKLGKKGTAKTQGYVLNTLDKATGLLYTAGHELPVIRWFIPFVQASTEIAKQGVELTPAGLADIPGSKDKIKKLATALFGATISLMAAWLAMRNRTTWSVPRGEKEKDYFYASGKKPYAVKIGDKWISYNRLGPVAYPLAWPAALKSYAEDKGMDENVMDAFVAVNLQMVRFFSDQTYMQGVGDLLKVVVGSEWEQKYYGKRLLTSVPRQLIPWASFQGWLARIIDDTYRNPDTAWESMKTQIPFLSKTVQPYVTPTGEPSKRKYPTFNAISPIDVSAEDPFYNKLYESYVENLRESRREREEVKTMPEGAFSKSKSPEQKSGAFGEL